MESSLLRCHDYPFLVRRWRQAARAAGLKMTAYALAGGFEIFRLVSQKLPTTGGLYLSAGIHGDEPAGTEALVRWVEANAGLLRGVPCVIYPCLNPWGLVNNARMDHEGRDLNRTFQHGDVPHIQALKKFIKPFQFDLALSLHEDYDGSGVYLYELEREAPYWGEELLETARPFLPIETRGTIDRRRITRPGILRRKIVLKKFPAIPEAVHLHFYHSRRTFTFETPSEFALDLRVRVQMELIDASIRRTLAYSAPSTRISGKFR